jgi:hypothetical protein
VLPFGALGDSYCSPVAKVSPDSGGFAAPAVLAGTKLIGFL